MKRATLFILVLLVAGWGMVFSGVRLGQFRVDSENNDLIVSWQAEFEDGIKHYSVRRLTRLDHDFVEIAKVSAQGANRLYVYRDDDIYKSAAETVEYSLIAVGTDGVETNLGRRQIAYTPTAVRRTWGSIKAMFQ